MTFQQKEVCPVFHSTRAYHDCCLRAASPTSPRLTFRICICLNEGLKYLRFSLRIRPILVTVKPRLVQCPRRCLGGRLSSGLKFRQASLGHVLSPHSTERVKGGEILAWQGVREHAVTLRTTTSVIKVAGIGPPQGLSSARRTFLAVRITRLPGPLRSLVSITIFKRLVTFCMLSPFLLRRFPYEFSSCPSTGIFIGHRTAVAGHCQVSALRLVRLVTPKGLCS